jgi:hypothetical protein
MVLSSGDQVKDGTEPKKVGFGDTNRKELAQDRIK